MTSEVIRNEVKSVITTDNASLIVSVDDVKARLVIETSEDDDLIESFIAQATRWAENYCSRNFLTKEVTYYMDCLPSNSYYWIELPAHSVQSVDAISYVDSDDVDQDEDTADYYIDTKSVALKLSPIDSWPSIRSVGFNNFTVVVTEGYGDAEDVPAPVISGLMFLIGHLYRNREATTAINFSEIPLGASSFLDCERIIYRNDYAGFNIR